MFHRVRRLALLTAVIVGLVLGGMPLIACTGIVLRAKDGAVVYGRTMEWGMFDLESRAVVVPRGLRFAGHLPDGAAGMAWQGKHGLVGVDALGKDLCLDGMNEQGLTVGLFYHPGFAQYPAYETARASESMAPTDVGLYLLSSCATVGEAREAMAKVRVVAVVEPALGIAPPVHFLVTDATGKSLVIEFLKGEMTLFDAPLGVITNAPSYDWHETNLRNYLNLSPMAANDKEIDRIDFQPLGAGSGMIGLPGDFTPPSRFVRATAFAATARPTPTGEETIYELFRILDNFNLPLHPAGVDDPAKVRGLRSATLWTTGYDTRAKVMYYHTQHNRRVRRIDLGKIDFAALREVERRPLDLEKREDYEDVKFAK